MQGSVLRTNYRKTGGVLDITAIGGGFPRSPGGGGGGTNLPYGGFIYVLSYCCSIGGSTNTFSNALHDSTYGLLSWYFTSQSPGSGYKFLPLGYRWKSISDVKIGSMGVSYSMGQGNYTPIHNTMSWTDSIFLMQFAKPMVAGVATGSATTFGSYSGEEALLDIWGFIVSGP